MDENPSHHYFRTVSSPLAGFLVASTPEETVILSRTLRGHFLGHLGTILSGALAGVYGHLLIDRFLGLSTGFPVAFAVEGGRTFQTILLIVIGALVALTIPGYVASQVPPQLALQD